MIQNRNQLPPEIQEILGDLPPVVLRRGDKSHPCYPQWKKMIEVCSNPNHPAFHMFGGRGISVMHRWYDFRDFLEDMEEGFEIEPSKPAILRRNYLARKNPRSGFNRTNTEWVPRSKAVQIQAQTKMVETPFNKVGGKGQMMTLRQLADYLKEHEGEELPEEIPRKTANMRLYVIADGKYRWVKVTLDKIVPVPLNELHRRHRQGLNLVQPPRPQGKNRESYADVALCDFDLLPTNPNG